MTIIILGYKAGLRKWGQLEIYVYVCEIDTITRNCKITPINYRVNPET